MYKNHTILFFPQWQGAGEAKEIYRGALEIRDHCLKEKEYLQIDISMDENLKVENDILGYVFIEEQLRKATSLLMKENPDKLFTIGGDCGVELAPVSYLNRKYNGDMAVIWFDAHGDLNTPQSSPSKLFHGMPLRTLLGQGNERIIRQCFSKLESRQIVLAGCRDLDSPEEQYINEHNISVLSVEELNNDKKLIDLINIKGYQKVYIHIDLDVIDPECFPSVMCPSCNGINFETLSEIIQKLSKEFEVVGFSVVEYVSHKEKLINEIGTLINLI